MSTTRISGPAGAHRRNHTPTAERQPRPPIPQRCAQSNNIAVAGAWSVIRGVARGLLDFDARVGHVVQPSFRIALQAPAQQSPNTVRRSRRQLLPVGLAFLNGGQRVGHGGTAECPVSCEHLKKHASERPDVGALIDAFAARLFGTHVGRRSRDDTFVEGTPADVAMRAHIVLIRANGLRQTEVEDLHRSPIS